MREWPLADFLEASYDIGQLLKRRKYFTENKDAVSVPEEMLERDEFNETFETDESEDEEIGDLEDLSEEDMFEMLHGVTHPEPEGA